MPTNLKKLVRSRMEKTGESYATALRYVRRRAEKLAFAAPARKSAFPYMRYKGTVPRDPRIDAYARSVPGPMGTTIARLTALVRRTVPSHDEALVHGSPWFCIGGMPFCYLVGHSKHVNLGFCDGVALPDPEGLLEGTGKTMRHVKVRPEKGAPLTALSQLIASSARRVREIQSADPAPVAPRRKS
jgi:hypothetical protein